MEFFSSTKNDSFRKYNSIVTSINFLEDNIKRLSDVEILDKVRILKKEFKTKENQEKLISESFALTREVAYRKLGLRHFDTQLIGGLVLNDGKIAEMKTGEGKTLVATLAASFNALSSKGVHLVTVNDYLAKRDKEWMQKIYQSLGLSVGLIQKEMNEKQRQLNYACDLTYVTNSEIGFDFLRDATAQSFKNLVLRDFNFCIIDEVDSILIDEARTPLILSTGVKNYTTKYEKAKYIADYLKQDIHYEINTKTKNVSLTDKGITLVQSLLGVNDLYSFNDPWISSITNAIKANVFYKKNQHYIVMDGKISIVDEFSGRVMPDRRWSEGLHQAIETKENVGTGDDLKTIASITYQSFFSLYPKLSGMTGTAKTAEEEFQTIYKLDVVAVPTKKPIERVDLPDLVFTNQSAKWDAVINECVKMYQLGRPTLVGTSTVEQSEFLSEVLSQIDIKHQVLNAKPENIKRESEIIAQAGRKKSITIATNMAGRGTDIILGGNLKYLVLQKVKDLIERSKMFDRLGRSETFRDPKLFFLLKELKKELGKFTDSQLQNFVDKLGSYDFSKIRTRFSFLLNKIYSIITSYYKILCLKENREVLNLGGLYVIGTERHESRRVDNQLRGRSGRQGDPGTSCFFISLEDNLFTIFGGEQLKSILKFLNFDRQAPIKEKSITNSLDKIQEKIENYYYSVRKDVLKYDNILSFYRNFVLKERRKILISKNIRSYIAVFIHALINTSSVDYEWSWYFFNNLYKDIFSFSLEFGSSKPEKLKQYKAFFLEQLFIVYDLKMLEVEKIFPGFFNQLQKTILLKNIDLSWNSYLEKTDVLGQMIGWQNYAQKDPLLEYSRECSLLFEKFLSNVRRNVIFDLFYF